MNPSLMYHALGVRGMCYTCTEYKKSSIYIGIRTPRQTLCCPNCRSRNVTKYGTLLRDIRAVPIGRKRIYLRVQVQRVHCKGCGQIAQEKLHFTTGKRSYTKQFARYVLSLLRISTIKDVAMHLGISWDTVKEIHKRYLHRKYAYPDFSHLTNIGIDEFAVQKGHKYKTIVVDLDTGKIVYVGDGKGKDALVGFWKRVRKYSAQIKHIATDLSVAFISSVLENAPDALDKVRRETYRLETDINKRNVIKGTRWLLLGNGKDLFDEKHKSRLKNALELNLHLTKAYYLKEDLREIWMQTSIEQAENKLM